MVQLKKYLPFQVILLFTLQLLSADDKFTTKNDVQNDAVIPHIVSGPGRILDVSKKSVVRNEEEKDINDLLYEVYRKFHTDPKRGIEKVQHKKKAIVETDAITYHQKKAVDALSKDNVAKKTVKFNHMKPVMKESLNDNAVKKEDHKIALRELERTIDKLIASLTKVSKDGKIEENEINKGIQDMSKFADVDGFADTSSKETGKEVKKLKKFGKEIAHTQQVHGATVYQNKGKEFEHFKQFFYKNFLRSNTGESSLYHEDKRNKRPTPKGIIKHTHLGDQNKAPRIKYPPPSSDYSQNNVLGPPGDAKTAQNPKIIPIGDPMKSIVLPSGDAKGAINLKVAPGSDSKGPGKTTVSLGKKEVASSSDLYKKARNDQLVRIPTIGKKEVASSSDLYKRARNDQLVRIPIPGKKEVASSSDLYKRARNDQLVRIPTIGKKEVASYSDLYTKPGNDQLVRIPTIGKKEITSYTDMYRYLRKRVLQQSKLDATMKQNGRRMNLDKGDKLEKLTIALVKFFNYINDREVFSYEKNKKKVQIITSFHPSTKTPDKQSKYRVNHEDFKGALAGKINVHENSKFEEKLEIVKFALVDMFNILNEEKDFVYNMNNREVIKPVTDVSQKTDDDILEDILNDLKGERSREKNSILQDVTSKKLRGDNYSSGPEIKHLEKRLLDLIQYIKKNVTSMKEK